MQSEQRPSGFVALLLRVGSLGSTKVKTMKPRFALFALYAVLAGGLCFWVGRHSKKPTVVVMNRPSVLNRPHAIPPIGRAFGPVGQSGKVQALFHQLGSKDYRAEVRYFAAIIEDELQRLEHLRRVAQENPRLMASQADHEAWSGQVAGTVNGIANAGKSLFAIKTIPANAVPLRHAVQSVAKESIQFAEQYRRNGRAGTNGQSQVGKLNTENLKADLVGLENQVSTATPP